mgnify:CR=1 FL=1
MFAPVMKKKAIFSILCISVITLTCWLPLSAKAKNKVFLTYGAAPATSPIYSYGVGIAKSIMKAYPEIQITVTECRGATDITRRVRSGLVDIGNSMSNTDYCNYYGTGIFEGQPRKDARIIWYFSVTPQQWVVARDSGIKTIEDLNGKEFNPGAVGASATDITKSVFELLGINPKYYEGAQSDAATAYKDRRIVGLTKAGPPKDSFVDQLNISRPVRVLSLTEEQIKKVLDKFPYFIKITVPENTYKGAPAYTTIAVMMGTQTTSALPQELGYKMFKAVWQIAPEYWKSAYPIGKDVNYPELTLKSKIPLHAGAVQYLKELGYEIPENLIPPEYKE